MPAQVFTLKELDLLKQGARKLVDDDVSLQVQLNMTKVQQKAANIALVDQQIAGAEQALFNLDASFDLLKSLETTRINDLLTLLSGLKVKLQSLPE